MSVADMGVEKDDPLLVLRGSGKHLWADEHADEYVKRLREGWEPAAVEDKPPDRPNK
jgi:hypothetical protein